jgi:hypothetical protein
MIGRALPTAQELQSVMESRKRDIMNSDIIKRGSKHFSYLTSSSNRFAPNHGRIGMVLKGDAINVPTSEEAEKRETHHEKGSLAKHSAKTSTKKTTKKTTKKKSKTEKKTKAKTTTIAAKASTKTTSTSAKPSSTSTTSSAKATSTAANAHGFPVAALNAADDNTTSPPKAVTASHSLGLSIEANDVGYIATVQIGSAGTNFRMLIDSGSADTWVPSSSCSGCGSGHQQLGPQVSSTYSGTSTSFSITYGTGSASGFLGSDTMKIAGMTMTALPFALITQETSDFSDSSVPFDGLMGLAKKTLSNSGNPTPIDALFSANLVPATVMGYHLARAADQNNDGEVTFGGVDGTKYTGNLVQIPNVSKDGFFEIAIQGASFGGKAITGIPSGSTAILDTGTTLMVAPSAQAKAIHAQIPGSVYTGNGAYTIPCNTTQQLSFTFGGQAWPINSEDMIFLPVNENKLNGACISSLSGGQVGSANEWLLGASFLKNVYFATNAKANVVGLGVLA